MRRSIFSRFIGLCAISGIVLFAVFQLASAQQDANSTADKAAILASITAQKNDWNQGNVRGFMQGYWNSPDLTFAGSTDFTRGWQPVLSRYEKTYSSRAAMGTLEFTDLDVRMLNPNAALVLGKWHLKREAGDVGGIFTLVYQKFPEGWRIIHDHTTQAPGK